MKKETEKQMEQVPQRVQGPAAADEEILIQEINVGAASPLPQHVEEINEIIEGIERADAMEIPIPEMVEQNEMEESAEAEVPVTKLTVTSETQNLPSSDEEKKKDKK